MSWLSAADPYRMPLAVKAPDATADRDVQFDLPKDWEAFWSRVTAAGADIRVTKADGCTPLTFGLNSFDRDAKTGSVHIKTVPVVQDKIGMVCLYWGDADGTAAATSVTLTSPLTAELEQARPDAQRSIKVAPEAYGDTEPSARLSKGSAEVTTLWWDFRESLLERAEPSAGKTLLEEIERLDVVDCLDDATTQPNMLDLAATRFLDGWVATRIQGGVHNTDYTLLVRVVTTLGRTLEGRALLNVIDVTE